MAVVWSGGKAAKQERNDFLVFWKLLLAKDPWASSRNAKVTRSLGKQRTSALPRLLQAGAAWEPGNTQFSL